MIILDLAQAMYQRFDGAEDLDTFRVNGSLLVEAVPRLKSEGSSPL